MCDKLYFGSDEVNNRSSPTGRMVEAQLWSETSQRQPAKSDRKLR